MKRMVQLVVLAALACGAEMAGAQEGAEPQVLEAASQSAESYPSVARVGQSAERHAAPEARPIRKVESLFESSGLAGHGPFPSRGGPIDD